MGEKAKEDKAEGRMAQGQRERMVSGFGEKDGGGGPALLLLHKLPALSTPTQCLPLLPSDNVLQVALPPVLCTVCSVAFKAERRSLDGRGES